jgi:hypothetical protein
MVLKGRLAALALGLTVAVESHMVIQNPAPYSISQKSPLAPDGSNFPCQAPSDYTQGTVANVASGAPQSIEFALDDGANTAVHGGGSCQVSITYETDATALKNPSNWKVLHSWIGGCPVDAPGNLDTAVQCTSSTQDNCVRVLNYTMPAEAPNGKAIMAWTWFNNIGNREMYMNCFPATITGSQGTQDTLNTLPELFTANIGSVSQGCATTESHNLNFPNPGSYVTTDSPLNFPLMAPVGCAAGVATGTGVAAPSSTATAGTFAEGANSSAVPVAAPTTLATVPAPAASTPTVAPAAPSSVAPQPAAPASPASAGTGSCATGQVTCSASGFYCIDATHFGMCAFGCATPMEVAAGTGCTDNAIGYASAKTKRWGYIRQARHLFGL